ncbi:MAG: tetratricopeptide repeat protein [bacterium]
MNQAKYTWEEMWTIFEELIANPRNVQDDLLKKTCIQHPEMHKELQSLLRAHYSQSSLLDEQPHWQVDFQKIFTPPKTINGYEIKEKLGSGGIGEVYKAIKKEDGFTRHVAIKFATVGRFSEHIIASFNTELKVLLSLNHPNIERLYDGGVTDGNIPFLIVEYINGTHITQYCDEHNLDVRQRLKLFQKVCSALDVVHRSLIIHRDIKASNIMVGTDGEPKLLDFGLAKLVDGEGQNKEEVTVSSDMMTLAYASPEQLSAEPITTTSDVYSLGVLLYRLLTGYFPYKIDRDDIEKTKNIIKTRQPEKASENVNPDSSIFYNQRDLKSKLSGELELIIHKSLNKESNQRYWSAAQFSEDIQNYFDNHPVMAYPDSVLYRLKKFVQRHRIGFSAGLVSALFLIILSVSLWMQSNHLKQSISAVETQKQRVMQVTDFLKDMFKISDPIVTDAKILKVKDLLDYSSQGLENKFVNQPLTRATLYEALGKVYLNLSELNRAEQLFENARLIFLAENDQNGLLLIHLDKTRLFQQKGQFNLAEGELSSIQKNFDPKQMDAKILADIEVFKGQNQYHLGRYKQAKELLQSALEKRTRLYGYQSEQVVDIYQLLGNVYWRLGDFEKVQTYYQKSYAINREKLGETHHKTIKSKSALGVLAYSQGDYEKALKYFDEVAQNRLEKLGETHILTAAAFNRLGVSYFETNQFQQAEKNLKRALKIYKDLKLDKSMKYARALNNLGLIERQNKQYKSAQRTFEKVKQLDIQNLGDKHLDLAGVNNNLGMVAADLGDFDQAIELFKSAYQIQYENNALNNANIAFSMTNLGRMFLHQGELETARDWLDKALNLRTEKLGKENLYRIETLSAKAELLIRENQLLKAKKALLEVVAVRQEKLPINDWRLAESKILLLSIGFDGNPQVKEKLLCSYQILESKLGHNHYRTRQAQRSLEQLGVTDIAQISCKTPAKKPSLDINLKP